MALHPLFQNLYLFTTAKIYIFQSECLITLAQTCSAPARYYRKQQSGAHCQLHGITVLYINHTPGHTVVAHRHCRGRKHTVDVERYGTQLSERVINLAHNVSSLQGS